LHSGKLMTDSPFRRASLSTITIPLP